MPRTDGPVQESCFLARFLHSSLSGKKNDSPKPDTALLWPLWHWVSAARPVFLLFRADMVTGLLFGVSPGRRGQATGLLLPAAL